MLQSYVVVQSPLSYMSLQTESRRLPPIEHRSNTQDRNC